MKVLVVLSTLVFSSILPTLVKSQEVLLRSPDGFINVEGEIIDFNGVMVFVNTSVGRVSIPASEVFCYGRGCEECLGSGCGEVPFMGVLQPRTFNYEVVLAENGFVFTQVGSDSGASSIDNGALLRFARQVWPQVEPIGLISELALVKSIAETIYQPPLTEDYRDDPILVSLSELGLLNIEPGIVETTLAPIRVQATPSEDDLNELIYARLSAIAQSAASSVFSEAAEYSCDVSPRPATISPSIKTSFNVLGASAEFNFEATFILSDICDSSVSGDQ